MSPSLDTVDGLGSGWAAVPGADSRIVTSLDAAGPDAAPGGAGNRTALECGAALRPQPPPSTWHPLNSSGATSHLAYYSSEEQCPHTTGHGYDHALKLMASSMSDVHRLSLSNANSLHQRRFAGQHQCMSRGCQSKNPCVLRQTRDIFLQRRLSTFCALLLVSGGVAVPLLGGATPAGRFQALASQRLHTRRR